MGGVELKNGRGVKWKDGRDKPHRKFPFEVLAVIGASGQRGAVVLFSADPRDTGKERATARKS